MVGVRRGGGVTLPAASEDRAGVGEQPIDLRDHRGPARVHRVDQRLTAPVQRTPPARLVAHQERHGVHHQHRVRGRDQQPSGGAIINMASVMGLIGYHQRAAYCSSKAAVVNLTRVLAVEWAEHNIRVNAVCPTFVDTPLTRPMFESQPEFTADVLKRTLLGRLATPEEIAAAVVFLASPGAAMVHGHALAVDGGWTAI